MTAAQRKRRMRRGVMVGQKLGVGRVLREGVKRGGVAAVGELRGTMRMR